VLTLSLALGLVIRIARGRGLSGLGDLHVQALWLCFVALAAKLALVILSGNGVVSVQRFGPAMHLLLYVILLLLVLANLSIPGMPVLLAGLLCNAAVIAANGGQMPVTTSALIASGQPDVVSWLARQRDATHAVAGSGTPLAFLDDWLGIAWGPLHTVVSPGDLLLGIGLILVLNLSATPPRQDRGRPLMVL